jgi:hypothetical protein
VFLAWIVFPLVLALLSLGCGLLLEQLAGRRLPGTLLLPAGLAVAIVAATFATASGTTASVAIPLVVGLAAAGFAAAAPWRGRRPDTWVALAAVAVFAVYAAPVVLSGEATFAGFLTLDDTATWLGLADQVLSHGRDLGGLAPSSYEAMLDSYLKQSGYPVGSFLPLGIGARLVGVDVAWAFQPYIAYAAAMLALGLYELTSGLIRSPRLRAPAVFVAAQPALLYAYSQWSGVKEVVSASMIALFAALLAPAVSRRDPGPGIRPLLPLGTVIAAELAALGLGGSVWLVTGLLVATVVLALADVRLLARRAVALIGIVLVLSVPALAIAGTFFGAARKSSVLTSTTELGNLIRPLDHLQVFGIWPSQDFRIAPAHLGPTYVLIAVLVAAAAAGLWFALSLRAWGLLIYVATLLVGCFLLVVEGSPWIAGKAMGTASTAFLLAGLVGCGIFFERGRRVEAAVAAVAIAGGVLWSNVLAYRQVWLAPRPALAELASIGGRFAGDGPTLMTEYQPYGVRHFLRRMAPESAGELRRRLIPLLDGQGVAKGGYADLDQFQTAGILVYRTLVLRRSPVESRPPSAYHLAWRGRYYEVWQRSGSGADILRHLPLGGAAQPGAVPACGDVLRLARLAGPLGRLAYVARAPVVTVSLATLPLPSGWQADAAGEVVPDASSGSLEAEVSVPVRARYGFWLGGSFRDRMELLVDGRRVAVVRHWINESGQYTPFGSAVLGPGTHRVTLEDGGADLRPGSGGAQFGFGPLVVSRGGDDLPVSTVPSARARTLCGRNLDWIEALGRT